MNGVRAIRPIFGEGSLVFIHLADMHFRATSNGQFDLDHDIRNELRLDIRSLAEAGTRFSGIFICGDIAWSGMNAEYQIASQWLDGLCDNVNCQRESVWVVPGNHDIDRSIVKKSQHLADARSIIRASNDHSNALQKRLIDKELAQNVYFGPLNGYNNFASRYQCGVSAHNPYWEKRENPFHLNDGSRLIVRGMTSVLLSDENDDKNANKLVLGAMQTICPRDPGVTWLSLCHHPPDWLHDHDEVDDALKTRVHVQLFGHKHRQRLDVTERHGFTSLRLGAGALHPDRSEHGWEPRYNLLALCVEGSPTQRRLQVTVNARRWDSQSARFGADGQPTVRFLPLDSWSPPAIVAAREPPANVPLRKAESFSVPETGHKLASETDVPMDPYRRLVYRFFTLPQLDQQRIIGELGLASDSDQSLDAPTRYGRCLARARERSQLAELWNAVERSHPEASTTPNPFSHT